MSNLYDTDFYAWANQQAKLLRAGKLAAADVGHIAEELETLGRTEKRELVSRLTILLTHLSKWVHQPGLRGRSWQLTIEVQRRDVLDHLADNPSLKAQLDDALERAYARARLEAARETGLGRDTFPDTCPWPFERIVADDFWPD
jgi:hypothetical protein